MANSPVQVVLNSSAFIDTYEKQGGGQKKDFYEGADEDFVKHKDSLYKQLNSIKEKQLKSSYSEISYVKLKLKKTALAKSHRPINQVFPKNKVQIVGGLDLGEMLVELNPSKIEKVQAKIQQAENNTRWKEYKGKLKANPSQLRSEVGAIEEISPYLPSDKRKFSVKEAIEWLSQPQTGGAYILELFETPPPRQDWDSLSGQKFKLFKSFIDGLLKFGKGTVAMRLIDASKTTAMLGVKLENSDTSAVINFLPVKSSAKRQTDINKINTDIDKHLSLINFLEEHPLVRRILLPPIITKSQASNKLVNNKSFVIPPRLKEKSYPKIGIVDGGVSSILGNWIEDSSEFLSPSDRDESHATFIAGLLLSGKSINGEDICPEEDGCSIIDIDLLPVEDKMEDYYGNKPLAFFDQLEYTVSELKAKTGVRIFNFSLNMAEHVSSDDYSLPAQILDRIAEENDVIFIISAGNTDYNDMRDDWSTDPILSLSSIAKARNDIIKTPAESSRNISVAALNPPNILFATPLAPASYSCRGPGMRVGLKPDLAHVGGLGRPLEGHGHGLLSIETDGSLVDDCGTSYAAPNIAKTLACLEHAIEGQVSRETLIALAIHNAVLPHALKDKKLKSVAKHLVGFGIPSSSEKILEGDDNSITLVFANRIGSGLRMSFGFSWPQSLVQNGKCYGHARLTIVSTPPFDYNFGAEFVRVNVDAHLRQRKSNGGYQGRLDSIYLPEKSQETGLAIKHWTNL